MLLLLLLAGGGCLAKSLEPSTAEGSRHCACDAPCCRGARPGGDKGTPLAATTFITVSATAAASSSSSSASESVRRRSRCRVSPECEGCFGRDQGTEVSGARQQDVAEEHAHLGPTQGRHGRRMRGRGRRRLLRPRDRPGGCEAPLTLLGVLRARRRPHSLVLWRRLCRWHAEAICAQPRVRRHGHCSGRRCALSFGSGVNEPCEALRPLDVVALNWGGGRHSCRTGLSGHRFTCPAACPPPMGLARRQGRFKLEVTGARCCTRGGSRSAAGRWTCGEGYRGGFRRAPSGLLLRQRLDAADRGDAGDGERRTGRRRQRGGRGGCEDECGAAPRILPRRSSSSSRSLVEEEVSSRALGDELGAPDLPRGAAPVMPSFS